MLGDTLNREVKRRRQEIDLNHFEEFSYRLHMLETKVVDCRSAAESLLGDMKKLVKFMKEFAEISKALADDIYEVTDKPAQIDFQLALKEAIIEAQEFMDFELDAFSRAITTKCDKAIKVGDTIVRAIG